MTDPAPSAPQRPKEITTHGDTRIDPWFWLRDVDDPETLEYLRAENAHTGAVMAPEEGLQERLFLEMPTQEADPHFYELIFNPLLKKLDHIDQRCVLKETKSKKLRAIVQDVPNLDAVRLILEKLTRVDETMTA